MVLPDTEVLLVQWAKANSALDALLSGRVSTRIPKEPVFPLLVVSRVAGSPDIGEAPLDQALVQWDAYGASGNDQSKTTPDYASASAVIRTLEAEAFEYRGAVGTFGTILGMRVTNGYRRIEEQNTGWSRYMVEMQVMTRE